MVFACKRVDPHWYAWVLLIPNLLLFGCMCVSLLIWMLTEQLCMTNRAWCLLAVTVVQQGKLSSYEDIWLFKAHTAGWSPLKGMYSRKKKGKKDNIDTDSNWVCIHWDCNPENYIIFWHIICDKTVQLGSIVLLFLDAIRNNVICIIVHSMKHFDSKEDQMA